MTDNPIMEPVESIYGKAEPIEPTEEPKVTEDIKSEVKEPVETEEKDKQTDESETVEVIELDDQEVSLEEVRKWREGHMMQSDYTKKTMALAEERKNFEAERESERKALVDEKAKAAEMRDMLEVLVSEDDNTDWDELWESDPDEWKAKRDKAEKRKKALDELRASRQTEDPAIIQAEQKKLFDQMKWVDNGKLTDKYEADKKLIESYAIKAGYSPDEFGKMTRAHHFVSLWKAAKYDEIQAKTEEVKRTREKVPVVTKPKAAQKQGEHKTLAQLMYGT